MTRLAILAALVLTASAQAQTTADAIHAQALDAARAGNLDHAGRFLEQGQAVYPNDKRFPQDLAGVAFRQKNNKLARHHIRRALHIDATDAYTNDFLATLYVLEGNLDAAVKYWNRVDKPRVTRIEIPDDAGIERGLLRRVLPSPDAPYLTAGALRAARTDIERLGVFDTYKLNLNATQGGEFELAFAALNTSELEPGKLARLLPYVRGLPYQAIHVDFRNLRGSAASFTSLWRWDPDKRRIAMALTGVHPRDPRWKLGLGVDVRQEIWQIQSPFQMHRSELTGQVSRRVTSRLILETATHYTTRRFKDAPAPGTLFGGGSTLKQSATASYLALHLPERRLTVSTTATAEAGRFFGQSNFGRIRVSTNARWIPSENWEATANVLAAKTTGQIPFDELFVIGMERDHDLWLRGHVATREGRKGASPLARDYVLTQSDTARTLYRHPAFRISAGPFLDTGQAWHPLYGSNKWMVDTGAQAKLRVLSGVTVTFVYGRNLRDGTGVFYTAVSR